MLCSCIVFLHFLVHPLFVSSPFYSYFYFIASVFILSPLSLFYIYALFSGCYHTLPSFVRSPDGTGSPFDATRCQLPHPGSRYMLVLCYCTASHPPSLTCLLCWLPSADVVGVPPARFGWPTCPLLSMPTYSYHSVLFLQS